MGRPGVAEGSRSASAFYPIVDALRALSVLAVVLYHAGVPGIPGGYVGVDVFFVISGFLIIGQIVEEHRRSGGFSYSGFWARRVLRILPTYLLVILATIPIAIHVLVVPGEFREFGREVAWSAGMVANHLFLGQQGYFDTAATSKPLLHLWSLAVEEQFYLFAPLVLGLLCWVAARFGKAGRGLVTVVVLAMFVASLWLCVKYTGADEDAKNYAFYLMPLRAWEFILGGAVPFLMPALRRWSPAALMLLMAAGFGLVLGAIFGFSHGTPFPSWRALIPAAGATMAIAAGLAAPGTRLVAVLTRRPVLWIGLISYAWYLWHWPLMAFARIYHFGELPLAWGLGIATLSMLLAALSYILVEKPIKAWRKRTRLRLGGRLIAGGVVACLAMVGSGQLIAREMPRRAAAGIPASMRPGYVNPKSRCKLVGMHSAGRCVEYLSKAKEGRVGVVVGDSFARAAFREIDRLARRKKGRMALLTQNGCVPIMRAVVFANSGKAPHSCNKPRDAAFRWISSGKIRGDYAILIARWNNSTPWETEPAGDGTIRRLLGESSNKPSSDQRRVFVDGLRDTLGKMRSEGISRILVIDQTPEFFSDPPSCVAHATKYSADKDRYCSAPLDRVLARRALASAWTREAVGDANGVRLIDPLPVFCNAEWCRPYDEDAVLFRDTGHLSDAGMRRIIDRYREDFDWVMGEG